MRDWPTVIPVWHVIRTCQESITCAFPQWQRNVDVWNWVFFHYTPGSGRIPRWSYVAQDVAAEHARAALVHHVFDAGFGWVFEVILYLLWRFFKWFEFTLLIVDFGKQLVIFFFEFCFIIWHYFALNVPLHSFFFQFTKSVLELRLFCFVISSETLNLVILLFPLWINLIQWLI